MDTQVIAAQMRTFLETFEELIEENSTLVEHLALRNIEIKGLKEENKKLEEEVDELRDGEDSFRDNMIDGLQAELREIKSKNLYYHNALNKVKRDLSPPR